MENPYWHDKFKPHQIDRQEIRLLCFEISNIVTSSMNGQGGEEIEEGETREFSLLELLCFQMAEAELSKRLLSLALLVRTFDDTMDRSQRAEEYRNHRKTIEVDHDFGVVFEGDARITETIRECCNKIIHAEDVRPVYDTQDDSKAPEASWGMDGTIELEGHKRERWHISLSLYRWLEGILELIKFDEGAVPGLPT